MFVNIKIVYILVLIIRIIFYIIIKMVKFIMDAGECLIMVKVRNTVKEFSFCLTNINLKEFSPRGKNQGMGF